MGLFLSCVQYTHMGSRQKHSLLVSVWVLNFINIGTPGGFESDKCINTEATHFTIIFALEL
jgi:hypothetical protein